MRLIFFTSYIRTGQAKLGKTQELTGNCYISSTYVYTVVDCLGIQSVVYVLNGFLIVDRQPNTRKKECLSNGL